MNHLAHALLAGADDDVLLGGMLGDFWRGSPDRQWRPGITAGVLLHRSIDVYTDSHPEVAAARARFAPPYRRYAGILLDVYFDHVLARDWTRYADGSLDTLSARMHRALEVNMIWLPPALNRFAAYFRAHGLFASYTQRPVIEQVLQGIGMRLKRANPLATAAEALWNDEVMLAPAFARFFPQLREHAQRQLLRLTSEN